MSFEEAGSRIMLSLSGDLSGFLGCNWLSLDGLGVKDMKIDSDPGINNQNQTNVNSGRSSEFRREYDRTLMHQYGHSQRCHV